MPRSTVCAALKVVPTRARIFRMRPATTSWPWRILTLARKRCCARSRPHLRTRKTRSRLWFSYARARLAALARQSPVSSFPAACQGRSTTPINPGSGTIDGWRLHAPARVSISITPSYAPAGYTCTNIKISLVQCLGGPPHSSPFTGILTLGTPTLPSLSGQGTTNDGATWGPFVAFTGH